MVFRPLLIEIILTALINIVVGDRLENAYLPPSHANTAGRNGNFLNTPNTQAFFGQSKQSTTNFKGHVPTTNYLPPSGKNTNSISRNNQGPDTKAGTLRFSNENSGDGSYHFEYETENKITQQETGELRNAGGKEESIAVKGSYSYMGPDGIMYTVDYIADENGFRATGAHIPTPPPVPEAILKSLEQNQQQNSQKEYASGNGQQSHQRLNQQYPSRQNHYQTKQTSRQYLAPNKPAFNQNSGYQY